MREDVIYAIRQFNRRYMPIFNLLGNSYLGSEYSAAEARVLFEVYCNDGCSAGRIARTMNLDKSYLSRTVKRHEQNGYIVKSPSDSDKRSQRLHLTEKGRARTEDFIARSNAQIGGVIGGLSESDAEALSGALAIVLSILEKCGGEDGQ